jgi:hypothetical protein
LPSFDQRAVQERERTYDVRHVSADIQSDDRSARANDEWYHLARYASYTAGQIKNPLTGSRRCSFEQDARPSGDNRRNQIVLVNCCWSVTNISVYGTPFPRRWPLTYRVQIHI